MTAQPVETEWLHLTAIAKELGCDDKTAGKWLKESGYDPTPVFRGRRRYLCYPPEALDEVRQSRQAKPAGNWLTIKEIARQVGRSHFWVAGQLDRLDIRPQPRIHGTNRLLPHYPPSALLAIRHANTQLPDVGDWLTFPMIARHLGVDPHWVARNLPKVGIVAEQRMRDGRIMSCAPPAALDALRRLRNSQLELPPMDDWMSVQGLAQKIRRSQFWVANQLTALGIEGEIRRDWSNRQVRCYPPETASRLIDCGLPEAGDWLSIRAIRRRVGLSEARIRTIIVQLGITGELRAAPRIRHPQTYYPPDTPQRVILAIGERPARSDGWYSAYALSKELGRSVEWVKDQLSDYADEAEMRLPYPSAKPCLHYPPEVLGELISRMPPPADGWLSASAAGRILRKDHATVLKLLEPYRDQAELRRPRSGKATLHYPPGIVETIRAGERVVPTAPVKRAIETWLRRNQTTMRHLCDIAGYDVADAVESPQLPESRARELLSLLLSVSPSWRYV